MEDNLDFTRKHYGAFAIYLENYITHENLLTPRVKARDKLSQLSAVQFMELSTDVYDEMNRREDETTQTSFLPVQNSLPPKRNQARQKLATLQSNRFKDLASDVFYELKRRYPDCAKRTQEMTKPRNLLPETSSFDSVNESKSKNISKEEVSSRQQDNFSSKTLQKSTLSTTDDQQMYQRNNFDIIQPINNKPLPDKPFEASGKSLMMTTSSSQSKTDNFDLPDLTPLNSLMNDLEKMIDPVKLPLEKQQFKSETKLDPSEAKRLPDENKTKAFFDRDNLEKQISDLKYEKSRLSTENEHLEKQNENLSQKLKQTKDDYDFEIESLNLTVNELKKNLAEINPRELHDEINRLKMKLEIIEADKKTCDEKFSLKEKELEAVIDDLSSLHQTCNVLREELKNETAAREALDKENQSLCLKLEEKQILLNEKEKIIEEKTNIIQEWEVRFKEIEESFLNDQKNKNSDSELYSQGMKTAISKYNKIIIESSWSESNIIHHNEACEFKNLACSFYGCSKHEKKTLNNIANSLKLLISNVKVIIDKVGALPDYSRFDKIRHEVENSLSQLASHVQQQNGLDGSFHADVENMLVLLFEQMGEIITLSNKQSTHTITDSGMVNDVTRLPLVLQKSRDDINAEYHLMKNETGTEFRDFLEEQTDLIIQNIQNLLKQMRELEFGEEVCRTLRVISNIVKMLIKNSKNSLSQLNSEANMKHGLSIINQLETHMKNLEEMSRADLSSLEKPTKQTVASGSYEIARYTKELVAFFDKI